MTRTDAIGSIKGGVLVLQEKVQQRLQDDYRQFPDCEVELTVKKRGKRSLPSNSYYWAVIVQEVKIAFLQKGVRMDLMQTHEFLKFHFNKKYIIDEETGEAIGEYGGSTTEMNQGEFNMYLEKIIEWCAEKLGVVIPPAGTQKSMFNDAKAA